MATLKIYDSIADEKPSKEFVCLRTTMQLNNRLEELQQEANLLANEQKELLGTITKDTSAEELEQIKVKNKKIEEKMNDNTLQIIRLFFPQFTDDDFLKLDPNDYITFIYEIAEMRNNIYNRALKN